MTATSSQQEAWIAQACTFDDVLELAKSSEGFRRASHDAVHNISMHTKVVPQSPIQLMKASAVMPCCPKHFLRYLDMDVRSLWDDHFVEGVVVQELTRQRGGGGGGGGGGGRTRAAAATANASHSVTNKQQPQQTSSSGGGSSSGDVKVQLKHIGFLSPIPFLQDRDFELVVAEHITPDGVAILKAFSPPIGSVVAMRSEYIRGVVAISGFVAEPLQYAEPRFDGKTIDGCKVTYVALVHPMGLIPSFVVNSVVGKQTSGLLQLQDFIASNPISALEARGIVDKDPTSGSKCGHVMRRRPRPKSSALRMLASKL